MFIYDRATNTSRPATNKDGSIKENANYVSFLQVISCYWEVIEESEKMQLNVFLNGGSVSRDRETGAAQMKAGYTVVLPQFLGERFVDEYYTWSCSFGLPAAPRPLNLQFETRREIPRPSSRIVREEEFVNDEEEATTVEPARFE